MLNPNPIPDVGSRWLKWTSRGDTAARQVEVEVTSNDARPQRGARFIAYRETATEYQRVIAFRQWRMPSCVSPVPAERPAVALRLVPPVLAPLAVEAPAHITPDPAPPACVVCGKPAARPVNGARTFRQTCSDACLREVRALAITKASLANIDAAEKRRAARAETPPPIVAAPTPTAPSASAGRVPLTDHAMSLLRYIADKPTDAERKENKVYAGELQGLRDRGFVRVRYLSRRGVPHPNQFLFTYHLTLLQPALDALAGSSLASTG